MLLEKLNFIVSLLKCLVSPLLLCLACSFCSLPILRLLQVWVGLGAELCPAPASRQGAARRLLLDVLPAPLLFICDDEVQN